MLKIQIFGEDELEEYIKNNGKLCSHCISITNPGEDIPTSIKISFEGIIRLEFTDLEEQDIQPGDRPATLNDINRIIDFYNKTKSIASGYTIHCWRGISRSTAVALCLLYLITKSEIKAKNILLQLRPKAEPNKYLIKLFDSILGTKLSKINEKIHIDRWKQTKDKYGNVLSTLIKDFKRIK